MTAGSETLLAKRCFWRWIAAWVAFFAIHALCMAIDWHLRDPAHPMRGGLPETIRTPIQLGSVGLLCVALFLGSPRSWGIWFRVLLTIIQVYIAFLMMFLAWLWYILASGIDSV